MRYFSLLSTKNANRQINMCIVLFIRVYPFCFISPCTIPVLPDTNRGPITTLLLHQRFHSRISLFMWTLTRDSAPLEWCDSTSSSLQSIPDSLLSPVTYLGGFLKRSQRKHFHFWSHLPHSNRARWRDSWLGGREWAGILRNWRWTHGKGGRWRDVIGQ